MPLKPPPDTVYEKAGGLHYWYHLGELPGLGDWSPMLDELDPFRDRRTAERIGTYIHWLLEGFNAEMDRETTMADAAERYCALWDKDKISQVNMEVAIVRNTWPD